MVNTTPGTDTIQNKLSHVNPNAFWVVEVKLTNSHFVPVFLRGPSLELLLPPGIDATGDYNDNQSINQSLLRQKAAHAETHNKNKHKLQTKLTAMK